MSHFAVQVIKMPNLEPHPNADSLSLVRLEEPYHVTVVCRTDDWKGVEKAVYIPVDSVVDTTRNEFSFLGDRGRVKAVKLRGVFSMGLLVPAQPEWEVGQDVTEELGVKKYDDTLDNVNKNKDLQIVKSPRGEVKYTDIESLRKYPNKIPIGTPVRILEKAHGANARYLYQDNQMFAGSHRQWLKEGDNFWWNSAFKAGLPEILMSYPDKIFFGEVYGSVQDMKYGMDKGQTKLCFFDIYDISKGSFLDYNHLEEILTETDLEMAPVFYNGKWQGYNFAKELAETPSKLYDGFKEGIVITPLTEQYDDELGRLILKYHSEKYLCRK